MGPCRQPCRKKELKLKRAEGSGSYLGLWGRPFPGLWGSRLLRSFSSRPAASLVVLAGQPGFKATSPFRRDTSLYSGGQRLGIFYSSLPRRGGTSPHSQRDPARTLVDLNGWVGVGVRSFSSS